MTLLELIESSTDSACIEPCWALLSFVTEQGAEEEENIDVGIVCKIFVRFSYEFDRHNSGLNSKKLAALKLFNMLKADKHSFNSQVGSSPVFEQQL